MIAVKRVLRPLVGKFERSFLRPTPLLSHSDEKTYSSEAEQQFFGYYDISPFSPDDRHLLAMRVNIGERQPEASDEMEVGVIDLETDQYRPLAKTTTWSWQQACLARWIDEGRAILFNASVSDQNFGARKIDLSSGQVLETFADPIYSLSTDERSAVTLNFSRLHDMRPGYGYVQKADSKRESLHPNDDGIFLIDMVKASQKKLIISLDQLARLEPLSSMDNAFHYLNHLCFSPKGDRFLFMHLWVKQGRRYNRMLTADVNGDKIFILNREGHSSHHAWAPDGKTIYIYATEEGQRGYYRYEDQVGRVSQRLSPPFPQVDGHPGIHPGGEWAITDTYPNRAGYRELYLMNLKTKRCWLLNDYPSPAAFSGQWRCDLHPRWNRKGTRICIDTIEQGRRVMKTLEVGPILARLSQR